MAGSVCPLVVITGRRLDAPTISSLLAAYGSPQVYANALADAGARPLILPPVPSVTADPGGWLDGIDGLVLAGGADIDPARYGQAPDESVYGIDPALDDLELALLGAALERGLPVLAVCRGMQVLNVAFGGTLRQDISEDPDPIDHGNPVEIVAATHDITIESPSRLADTLGVSTAHVVSIHHQAVDRVGDGLRVTARAEDGIVEALEPVDPEAGWVVGVQWHPERRIHPAEIQRRLFAGFVAEAARHTAAVTSN
jgi:putative glutamine amidotransferase